MEGVDMIQYYAPYWDDNPGISYHVHISHFIFIFTIWSIHTIYIISCVTQQVVHVYTLWRFIVY